MCGCALVMQILLSWPGKIITVLAFIAVFIGLAYNGFVNTSRGLAVSKVLSGGRYSFKPPSVACLFFSVFVRVFPVLFVLLPSPILSQHLS